MAFKIDINEIDITKVSHLQEIIAEIEGEQNVERKRVAYVAYESMEGRQYDHVTDRLKQLYPDSYKNFRVADVNIPKKVIRKKAKAYKQQPMRKLSTEAQTKALTELYDTYKFSRAFKEADKIYNLHKYVALWVSYTNPEEGSTELEGKYNLRALAPYEYDMIVGKHGEKKVFVYNYGGTDVTKGADGIEQTIKEDQRDTSAESKRYKFISKEAIVEIVTRGYNASGKSIIDRIDVKPNKVGVIPVAFLSQDTSADYPIPAALGKKSIDWNAEFSDLRTAAAVQGHGQLTVSHPEKMKMKRLHMGMFTAINLPQSSKDTDKETKANYISANPDLMGQLAVLKFSLLQILDDEGITSNSAIEGGIDQVKSGFDRVLKEADVQDIIEDNQSLYEENLEQEVYLIVKSFRDALNNRTFTDDKVEVSFDKPTVLISDSETLDNIKKREELGTLLAHEKHMILNPNLGDTEAKKREEEIQTQKQEKMERMSALMEVEDEEEDDLPPTPNEGE